MKKEYFLDRDCKVSIGEEVSQQRVLILNPEAFEQVSSYELWNRLLGAFGKCEFEAWVAEEIIASAMYALASGNKAADITEMASSRLYTTGVNETEWKTMMSNKTFRKALLMLPIFKVLKADGKELLLEYIPQK